MKAGNILEKIRNSCLEKATDLLDGKTAPTADTVETVRMLVDIAISIDLLNLRWIEQNQCGAAVFQGQTFPQKEVKN